MLVGQVRRAPDGWDQRSDPVRDWRRGSRASRAGTEQPQTKVYYKR